MNAERPSARPVPVAVGVIRNAAGHILVSRRQTGKTFAGQWEFPGGKIEPGESAAQALGRELEEELGILVVRHRPLIRVTHCYPDLTVRLFVMEVVEHQGTPEGRERQVLDWVAPAGLHRLDLLAGGAAILSAVLLPRFCLITDTRRFGVAHTLECLREHVRRQRALIIIRERAMKLESLHALIRAVTEICHPVDSLVCVHADCGLHGLGHADGTHLPARMLDHRDKRQLAGISGASCHSLEEICLASRRGSDYILLSPVNPTASHPVVEPLGWTRFDGLCAPATMPVYALGGLTFADFETAIEHGAQGVAVLSAAWE